MQINLTAKVAVVTGASSGIGLAIARRLVESGATVFITGRNRETVEKAATSIGENCIAVRADVTRPKDMQALIDTVRERSGHLDIVVANAGVGANARLERIAMPSGRSNREVRLGASVRRTRWRTSLRSSPVMPRAISMARNCMWTGVSRSDGPVAQPA